MNNHKRYTKPEALTAILQIIRVHGYISRTKAETQMYCSSTGEIATRYLGSSPEIQAEAMEANGYTNEADDLMTIKTMIQWGKTCGDDDATSYLSQLQAICQQDQVEDRHLGFLASLPSAWKRATEREQRIENAIHIGNVGDALQIRAKLTSVRQIETRFGTSYLCKFVGETEYAGKLAPLTWFASRKPEIAEGTTVTLKGKVKKHDDKFGVATVVTRCKLTPTEGN